MDLRDLAYGCQPLNVWLSAYRDDNAWRWLTVEHYCCLRDRANELLQGGIVSIETRNQMVTEAFRCYLAYLDMGEAAAEMYAWHYTYDVFDGDHLFAFIESSGHLRATPSRELLGCVGQEPGGEIQITRYVDYSPLVVGTLKGLVIEQPEGPPWRIALALHTRVTDWSERLAQE